MKSRLGRIWPWLALGLLALAAVVFAVARSPAGDAEGERSAVVGFDATLAASAVESYAKLMHAMYSDSVVLAAALQKAVDSFVRHPTREGHEACKTAWLAARPSYIQTEVGRFYDGPIDGGPDAREKFINAWPLDEAYIDYVRGNPSAGIINDPANFPKIDAAALRGANEKAGARNISTGWHAIEFLLWGQDLVLGPGGGQRTYLDYVANGGTAAHEARRGEYLRVCADLLVADLTSVRDQWVPGNPNNYGAWLVANLPKQALVKMIGGVAMLAFAELRGERLIVPFVTKDKENEHSCFSDTTHLDHINDMIGIRNVWQGRYASSDGKNDFTGTGLRDVAFKSDPGLAREVEARIESCIKALRDPALDPFEVAIQGDDTTPGRVAIQKALDRLLEFSDSLFSLSSRMGVGVAANRK